MEAVRGPACLVYSHLIAFSPHFFNKRLTATPSNSHIGYFKLLFSNVAAVTGSIARQPELERLQLSLLNSELIYIQISLISTNDIYLLSIFTQTLLLLCICDSDLSLSTDLLRSSAMLPIS